MAVLRDDRTRADRKAVSDPKGVPIRYRYLRDGDAVRAWALTPGKQVLAAVAAVLPGGWALTASDSLIFNTVAPSQADRAIASGRVASEHMNGDLQARLDRAVIRMTATTGSLDEMAQMVERHPALHQGQDFAAPLNTPIRAPAPGIVSFAGVRSGYGNTVEIDNGRGFKTRYAHLNSMAVRPGQRIVLGQKIGAMGTTGRSTGVHLHYEVWMNGRPQNPARFMRAGDRLVQQD